MTPNLSRSIFCLFLLSTLLLVSCKDAFDVLDEADAHLSKGNPEEAARLLSSVLSSKALRKDLSLPQQGQVLHNLGMTQQRLGRISSALESFSEAGRLLPKFVDSRIKAAWCANELGQAGLSVSYLQEALSLPNPPPFIWQHLGDMLNNLKRFDEATAVYLKGIAVLRRQLQPPPASSSRPISPGDSAAAATANRKLFVKLLTALGDSLVNQRRSSEAISAYLEAKEAMTLLFESSHKSSGRGEGAGSALPSREDGQEERSVMAAELYSSLMVAKREACDWSFLEQGTEDAIAASMQIILNEGRAPGVENGLSFAGISRLTPYAALFLDLPHWVRSNLTASVAQALLSGHIRGNTDRSILLNASWDELHHPAFPRQGTSAAAASGSLSAEAEAKSDGGEQGSRKQSGRRAAPSSAFVLGYISRRFEDYPGTHLLTGLFSRHSRSTKVACFAAGADDGSEARRHVKATCSNFEDISQATSLASASRIARLGTHVLIDYDGMHDFNSMKALMHRPAAVQLSWLGFAASSGFSPRWHQPPGGAGEGRRGPVDYTIVDDVIAPVESASQMFTERLLYLPSCYQPQDPAWQLSRERLILSRNATSDAEVYADVKAELLSAYHSAVRSRVSLERDAAAAAATDDSMEMERNGTLAWESDDFEVDAEGGSVTMTSEQPPALSAVSREPVIFASFNRWEKTDPTIWTVWMNVLRSTSPSYLWIYGGGAAGNKTEGCFLDFSGTGAGGGSSHCDWVREHAPHLFHLRNEAAANGIDPRRIVFAPQAPRSEHLWRHYAADVLLDSRVYGAHTTASEGFFTGLPLVTMEGPSFAARVGSSIAQSVGADALGGNAAALITHSLQAYEATAVTVALLNSTSRRAWRGALQEQVIAHVHSHTQEAPQTPDNGKEQQPWQGLFDAQGFARGLDHSGRAAYEIFRLQKKGEFHVVVPRAKLNREN